jgi:hypothetical protein
MEMLTPRAARRSTRLCVEIPVTVTSLDRKHPFSAKCVALVVSPQSCGFLASQALPLETPVRLNDLPGGGSVSARVATCLPLGNDGRYFLTGVALYNQGNVWGIADPSEDWNCAPNPGAASADGAGKTVSSGKNAWSYHSSPDTARPIPAENSGHWSVTKRRSRTKLNSELLTYLPKNRRLGFAGNEVCTRPALKIVHS